MTLRRGVRDWLLAKDADPSVRLRVLRDVLGRPEDDPAILRAQKEIGRQGWAAKILAEQHPKGHWATPGTSATRRGRGGGPAPAPARGPPTAGGPPPRSRPPPPTRGPPPSNGRSSGAPNSPWSGPSSGRDESRPRLGSASTTRSITTTTSSSAWTCSRPWDTAKTRGCGPPSTVSRRCG